MKGPGDRGCDAVSHEGERRIRVRLDPLGWNPMRHDDDGDVHEADIDALAAAGILGGYDGDRFGPNDPTSRAQLALAAPARSSHRSPSR